MSKTLNATARNKDERIDRLFAVVHVNPNGGEGVIAVQDASGGWNPLVTPDRQTGLDAFAQVRAMPEHKDVHLRLLQFTKRAVMAEHNGDKQVKC